MAAGSAGAPDPAGSVPAEKERPPHRGPGADPLSRRDPRSITGAMGAADPNAVRQLVYRSVAIGAQPDRDLIDILAQSRMNNGLEGVSGILLASGGAYLQVLEGGTEGVAHVFDRIRQDGRHRDVEVLRDESVERRSFGGWGMASLQEDDGDHIKFRIERFLADAPDTLRAAFTDAL